LAAYTGGTQPINVRGIAVFDKQVTLFGSEGSAKIYSSADTFNPNDIPNSGLPVAVVEALDPICLNVHLSPPSKSSVPQPPSDTSSRCYCTLGQFSIIRLERGSQLVMPCYDFCMPEKECVSEYSPRDLFGLMEFPADEFFPPSSGDFRSGQ
jgi:hypothetical protein